MLFVFKCYLCWQGPRGPQGPEGPVGQKVRNLREDGRGSRSLFRSASECKNPSACLGKCINARINCWVRRKGRIAHIFGQLPSVKHCNLFRLKYETLGGGGRGVERVHLLTCLPPLPVSSRVSNIGPCLDYCQ